MNYVILEKAKVIGFYRTRKGKREYVREFERRAREKQGYEGAFDIEREKTDIQTIDDIDKFVPQEHMTKKQRIAVKYAIRQALEYIGVLPGWREKTSGSYEVKRFVIKKSEGSPLVFVHITTGLKADEGTAASILARDRFSMVIGVGGSIKSFRGKNFKPGVYPDI